jgi:hypothetical protein
MYTLIVPLEPNRVPDRAHSKFRRPVMESRITHPNTVKRLKAYLEATGHADDLDRPLFAHLVIIARSRKRGGICTPKLYDRRGYNPEKSASYCATY